MKIIFNNSYNTLLFSTPYHLLQHNNEFFFFFWSVLLYIRDSKFVSSSTGTIYCSLLLGIGIPIIHLLYQK